ncbi:MAG TPA: ATP-binding cassette domain-containing protein, partial [Armatimonadota bacterium]
MTIPSATYSIVAEGLTKQFGGTRAVDGITLRVAEGEFFGFLGPNGAGKSTTIKMLCGLLRPTAGAIRIAGYDLQREPLAVKARIGVLPEELNLYERLSAEEFLVFAGRMYGLPLDEARKRTAEL